MSEVITDLAIDQDVQRVREAMVGWYKWKRVEELRWPIMIPHITSYARSEFFASPQERVELADIIHYTREFVLANGQPGDLALYQHKDILPNDLGDKGLANTYWRNIKNYVVSADLKPLSNNVSGGSSLVMVVTDQVRDIQVSIQALFEHTCSLLITFSDRLYYLIRRMPYSDGKITDQEYRIMRYYLEQYLQMVA